MAPQRWTDPAPPHEPGDGSPVPSVLTPDQLRTVVSTATAAPSVHNTQPWSFALSPAGLDVRADGTRALPRQDPEGRELLLSCGAASLHAELAVRGLGRSCRTEVLPDGDDGDTVARLVLGGPRTPSPDELRLLAAVPLRHTDRGPYAEAAVPVALLDVLGASTATDGVWLQVLTTADVLELALLQSHAQAALLADPAAVAERASWGRASALPPDGVPAELVPGWAAGTAASRGVRWSADSVPDVVLVLGTADDTRHAWVRAGRALARVLLEVTSAGLVAAPATLALELPAIRLALTHALTLRGAPQMVLRVGYPAGAGGARTARRPVDEVLQPAPSG